MKNLLNVLKEESADCLIRILRSIEGKKDLILDDNLIWSLDYIAKLNQLKECQVDKIFKLERGASPDNSSRCVYLVRSTLDNAQIIANHILANQNSSKLRKYWIILVPRRIYLCDKMLENEGVYGYVKLLEFPLGFIPVDSDMLSLELPNFFTSFFLDGDQTLCHSAALALVHLQKICGIIPNVCGQGRCSNMVLNIMKRILSETEGFTTSSDTVSHLIVFDRDVDYVSVLLTQLNFEGLLDETFDIKSGRVSFGKEVTGQDQVMKMVLNDDDIIFSAIRNAHFTAALSIMNEKAKELKINCDKVNLTIDDMKQIVAHKRKTVHQERLLPLYINASEVIVKQKTEGNFQEQLTTEHNLIEGSELKKCQTFIKEAINRQVGLCCSLRLLCLLSVTQDGLGDRDYKTLMVQFLQSYGHKHMITLHNLRKLGLFVEQTPVPLMLSGASAMGTGGVTASKIAEKVAAAVASLPRQSSFRAIAKKMNLIANSETVVNLKQPTDMSYVFNGVYAPLIGKLTEQLVCSEPNAKFEEALKLLPGPHVSNIKASRTGSVPRTSVSAEENKKKIVLVFFLGGVTYAEVTALRFLGKTKGFNVLIATTSIINGTTLMKMLTPDGT